MKKAAGIDHQRLASDAVSTAQGYHLIGNVILVRGPLEKRALFGLLLEVGVQVGGSSGAFQVARGNAIDENLGCQPHGHTTRQMNEPGFGNGIGNGRSRWHEASYGGNIHNAAIALLAHDRRHSFDTEHGSGEIDVEDLLPLLIGHGVQILEGNPFIVGGIVHQNVHATKHLRNVRNELLHLLRMRNVARHGFSPHARLAELAGHFLSLRLTLCIHHCYMATSLGQSMADALTQPTIPTRDDCHSPL